MRATKPRVLVSIIVPVYDVLPYLAQCVDSILAQTYSNIEVILVDDGSPDGCGELCDAYEKRDSRVTVIHKSNGGVSSARNYGASLAQGEWVLFVDADDVVSPVYIETLLSAAVESGCPMAVVPGGLLFVDGEFPGIATSKSSLSYQRMAGDEYLTQVLYQRMTTGPQWRLVRRDVLGLSPFPEGITLAEDVVATCKITRACSDVALVESKELVGYRIRKNSALRRDYTADKAKSALFVCEWLRSESKAWGQKLSDAAASRCFSVCRMVFAQVSAGKDATPETRQDRDALWRVVRENRRIVLHDSHARRRERLAAAIALLGLGPFSFFCSVCRRFGLMQ